VQTNVYLLPLKQKINSQSILPNLFGVAGMILAVPLGVVMQDIWELLHRGVN